MTELTKGANAPIPTAEGKARCAQGLYQAGVRATTSARTRSRRATGCVTSNGFVSTFGRATTGY